MKIINKIEEAVDDGFYIIKHPTYKWNEYFVIVKDDLIQDVLKACGVSRIAKDVGNLGVTLITDSGCKIRYKCEPDEGQEILCEFAEMTDDTKEVEPCPEQ